MPATASRRKQLTQRLSELDQRLREIEGELDAPHSRDWDEAAVEREGEEVLEGIGAAGMAEVARIKAALKRMDDGEYGICVKCGDEIAGERLDLLPATPFCHSCAA